MEARLDDIAECFRLIREAFPGVQVAAYRGGRSTDFMMELTGSVDWLRVPHSELYAGTAVDFVNSALERVVLGDPKTGVPARRELSRPARDVNGG